MTHALLGLLENKENTQGVRAAEGAESCYTGKVALPLG